MNQNVTSKQEILKTCRDIVRHSGLMSLNIRSVAAEANIVSGTVYNYFENKDELMVETVESIWRDIFFLDRDLNSFDGFCEYVETLYDHAMINVKVYPDFLSVHSMAISALIRKEAKSVMDAWFSRLEDDMNLVLKADHRIDAVVFDELDRQMFIHFVKDHLLISIIQKKPDLHTFRLILEKVLYGGAKK